MFVNQISSELKIGSLYKVCMPNNINLAYTRELHGNYDNLKLASDSSLPHVRTDIVKYLKESKDYSVRRMQLNYFLNPRKDFYAKLSGGLLEEMFGGVGGEVLYRPFNKT